MKISGLIIALVLFASFAVERVFSFKFRESTIIYHYNNLTKIRDFINQSNLPHQDVVIILANIDSLQKDILPQLLTQMKDTLTKSAKK